MTPQQFTGRIKKICEARTFKTGSSSRQFWAEESGNGKGKDPKYPNILAFEVFTSSKGPSEHYAGVADLDGLKPGMFVKFNWEPKGNVWKGKDGRETCFVKLAVASKIDVLSKAQPNVPAPTDPEDYSDPDDGGSMPF